MAVQVERARRSLFGLSLVRSPALWGLGVAALVASGVFMAHAIEPAAVGATWRAVASQPASALPALGAYGLAFVLRAALWHRLMPQLPFTQALAAVHVSLGSNHLLPLRLGEAMRVTSAVRRTCVPLAAATASTLLLRAADGLAAAGLAVVLGHRLVHALAGPRVWAPVVVAVAIGGAGAWWLWKLARRHELPIVSSAPLIAVGSTLAWVLESAIVWQAGRWAGLDLSLADATFVTAVTILAQAVALTPGGVGTYEAAAGGALMALGAEPGAAVAAAIFAHAAKTAYAFLSGAVATFVPAPGLFGYLRLRTARPSRRPSPPPPQAPVVFFLPAHNEAAAIGDVLRRVPQRAHGRKVICLVVDDGSTDATGRVASEAGARVVSLPANTGLGAAVRTGLREALTLGPAAIAFCDADGEYAPEELESLLAPVLAGQADYVVGSRFAGAPRRMRPYRFLGNIVLTRLLSFVARAGISDGQSGYRALSVDAGAHAEIVHDYNYAQVLTLDLLAKGYRYMEVPISYGFRRSGRSFVKLGRYLRRVVPAVHHELNAS